MDRDEVSVAEEKSEPNKIKLTDGSYLQWDHLDGFFRVAYYERRTQRGSDLEMSIALAMKRPVHNSRVKKIFDYISKTDEYAAVGP